MPQQNFSAELLAAARAVARIEVRLRAARSRLAELEGQHSECKRLLRLLVQSTEPYTPPTADELRDAQQRAPENE